jgi:hypothetical protein
MGKKQADATAKYDRTAFYEPSEAVRLVTMATRRSTRP